MARRPSRRPRRRDRRRHLAPADPWPRRRSRVSGGHIPGAVFFDIDKIADTANPLPHMLPSPEVFAAAVGALGIDERQTIVVYDSVGLSSAPRLWWTFKVMGARTVVILDGGLPKWRAEGRPIETGDSQTFPADVHGAGRTANPSVTSPTSAAMLPNARLPARRRAAGGAVLRRGAGAAFLGEERAGAGQPQRAVGRPHRRRPPEGRRCLAQGLCRRPASISPSRSSRAVGRA